MSRPVLSWCLPWVRGGSTLQRKKTPVKAFSFIRSFTDAAADGTVTAPFLTRDIMSRLEEVRDSVLAHPLHRACELELLSAGEGRSEVRFTVNEFTTNPMGALHGGIVYALMDVACFFAVVPSLSADQQPVTVETHSSVLRAAMKGETVVLDQSFRVPKEVHRVAERIASRISTRQAKKYLPTNREGKTERLPSVDVLPTKEGEWLILASCDYMLNGDSEGHNIRKRLVDQGVPFSHNGFRYIPHTMIEAVDAWKELKQKKKITVGRLETIYRYLSKTEVKRGFLSAPAKEEDKSKVVKKKEVVDLFGLEKECLDKTWEEVFSKKIKEQKRAFIKKALKNKEDLHSEPRISLSTIHKAKGGEADNVAVLLDLSPAQKLNATLNADSLHRQFYVAVTRARENLFLINAQNETLQYGL